MRTGPETLTGLAFPSLEIGRIQLPFSTLEYFLSSTSLYPEFRWLGRQELQLELFGYNHKQAKQKTGQYGQENILQLLDKDKVFENGYYLVPFSID